MPPTAISDLVTVVGSAYFQPIADLIENLTRSPAPAIYAPGTSNRENGYAASISVLLVAVLESYTTRLRFVRKVEFDVGSTNTPDLLEKYFPDIPNKKELVEVFLLRNLLLHNHIWHLDVSDVESQGAPTLATPIELGFKTNKHYEDVVDIGRRKTKTLELNVSPTSVDRSDAQKVFTIVWNTLSFMGAKNFSHTPLANRMVRYQGKNRLFEELIEELDRAKPLAAA